MKQGKVLLKICLLIGTISLFLGACDDGSQEEGNSVDGDADGDSDGDTDGDGDGDADGDSDGDSDGDADPIELTHKVRLLPIQVALDDGTDPANPDRLVLEEETAKIWAQAGIEVHWLEWIVWNSTAAHTNPMESGLDDLLAIAPLHEDPNVANVIFVKDIDGVSSIGGLSQTPGNVMFMAEWTFGDTQPAHVMGHELGHNLGLGHEDYDSTTDTFGNLMYGTPPDVIDDIYPDGAQMAHLTDEQIERVFESPLVVPLDEKSSNRSDVLGLWSVDRF